MIFFVLTDVKNITPKFHWNAYIFRVCVTNSLFFKLSLVMISIKCALYSSSENCIETP